MSSIPSELRDEVVRRLEGAITERDRELDRATHDAQALRRTLGELEGDMERQGKALRAVEKDLRALVAELVRERREALDRLERLRSQSAEQHKRLVTALQEAERRHREEWEVLQARIEELALARERREFQTRAAGRQALVRAQEALQSLDRGQLEAMDLLGDLAAAESRIALAQTVTADTDLPAAESLSAGFGAEEAVKLVVARLERRQAEIAELSRALAAEADRLTTLLNGEEMLDLPDQREAIEYLLMPETPLMRTLIETHIRAAAVALRRWNGHAARVARIEAIRDWLSAEILRARQSLGGALRHEQLRYGLAHIWDDLVLRFGAILELGTKTEGAWTIPRDRKSSYLYFLKSGHGEVIVEVPWNGHIVVRHEGSEMQRHPLSEEPDAEARVIGELASHWRDLAVRLANPNWEPDLS